YTGAGISTASGIDDYASRTDSTAHDDKNKLLKQQQQAKDAKYSATDATATTTSSSSSSSSSSSLSSIPVPAPKKQRSMLEVRPTFSHRVLVALYHNN